jgi:hypothetical protein
MGRGGAAYFDLAGLNIGIGNGLPVPDRWDMWVVDRTADIYNTPNGISIPPTGVLNVYEIGAAGLVRIGIVTPPNGVSLYASESQTSKVYPFVDEPMSVSGPGTLNNFLWGFHGSPTDLTPVGDEIFENVVKFVFDDGTKDVFQPGP